MTIGVQAMGWIAAVTAPIAAVLLDRLIGEPQRAHPLIGFGRWAGWLERKLNPAASAAQPRADNATLSGAGRVLGILAWCLAVVPPVIFCVWLLRCLPHGLQWVAHVLMLWFALGAKSLDQHIAPVGDALLRGDLSAARQFAARVVSRDLSDADETAVARAAVESALENGSDAIFAALFWFMIGGGPAAVALRLLNTLDAMWGYRTPRLHAFGWAAARIDDVANWMPARLSASIYCLLGERAQAWRCWQTQANAWDSPNAGPVMAAGAGSLGVTLGGAARYHGNIEARPTLGCGPAPGAADVGRALQLVRSTTWSWLLLATIVTTMLHAWF